MSDFQLAPGFSMHYEADDFTDPWTAPETVLLLHGNCESGLAWFGWVPQLARHFRTVRPDMRGFGASTPMPRSFVWSLDLVIDDFVRLMDSLGVEQFHLVGAKIGGTIARACAARRPDRVKTLTIVGSPPPTRTDQESLRTRLHDLQTNGAESMRAWASSSMGSRLGSTFSADAKEWWVDFMCRTSVETSIGFHAGVNMADITDDVPRIKCPTLVITTEGSSLASVQETRAWQEQIADSRLVVVPGDSFHAAVTDADLCARFTLEFLQDHREQ
ncbi:MAG: alpha/beta fold hydrolase [Chloroflexota bacterium]